MDYNDLKQRLNRVLVSFNSRFDENVTEKVKVLYEVDNESVTFTMMFGNESQEELINKVYAIIQNLAGLKDHLKNSFEEKNIDPKIVERAVDNSFYLQVLIDMNNLEKHGYPLRKPRSNITPQIINLCQYLSIFSTGEPNSGGAVGFGLHGEPIISGNTKIGISANICDKGGDVLFSIDELFEKCYEEWIELIRKYDIL